ncbi:leucyl aminopeptidase [Rhodococcus qingshengii]|uniref:leucyl aminopeptidase n=1 Tax=Rhodococcus qingshengii TaxID=334542 RepID=UPI0028F25EC1|nr:leucyl aminopeptidase [Rhodococcus qingshengii]MDT9660775.1 leucyl aminopeptidase [Rhodococcus qingshengii]
MLTLRDGSVLVLTDRINHPAEVLIVGIYQDPAGPVIAAPGIGVDARTAAELAALLSAVGATGKPEEVTRIPAPSETGVRSVVAVGLGEQLAVDDEQIRKSAGAAARTLSGVESVVCTMSLLDLAATAEGLALGAFSFDAHKADRPDRVGSCPLSTILLVVTTPLCESLLSVLRRSVALVDAVTSVRQLVNTPPNLLYPEEFARRVQDRTEGSGLVVQVLDESDLLQGGFGGILGVGQGSARPPRLVRMHYSCAVAEAPTVALVGKGITFDTGGISIKAAVGMEHMTSDMAGAAAVLFTCILAAELAVPVNVIVYAPMAENMPSGSAQRPGDVVTQYGGTTVEVVDTDAEGRLVLADAIVRACEDEPDYLIDVATLTGAQTVALGSRTSGVMGTAEFRDRVAAIGLEVGERAWAMPLPEELREVLESNVADIKNIAPQREGGMLVAGLFLREFVTSSVQWAHVDIDGPAYNIGKPWGYNGMGGTGVPVRTLFAVVEDIARHG